MARTRSQSRRIAALLRELNNVSGSALSDDIIRTLIASVYSTEDSTSTHTGGVSGSPVSATSSAIVMAKPVHHHRHSRGAPRSACEIDRLSRPTQTRMPRSATISVIRHLSGPP